MADRKQSVRLITSGPTNGVQDTSVILLGVSLIIIGLVCIQLLVSGLTEQVRTLGEAIAHLNNMSPVKVQKVDVSELTRSDI